MRARSLFAALAVAALILVGVLLGPPAAGQEAPFPVLPGQRITLSYPPTESGAVYCTVNAVHGDFVRCDPDGKDDGRIGAPTRRETWYNLRTAKSIAVTIPR